MNLDYRDELKIKQDSFKALVDQHQLDLNIRPIVGSPLHTAYRNKISPQFKKLQNGQLVFGMAPFGKKTILEIDTCPMARSSLSEAIVPIRENLQNSETKKKRGCIVMRCDQEKFKWGGLGKKSLKMQPEEYFHFEWDGKKVYYSLDTFFQANTSILPLLFEQLLKELAIHSQTHFYDLYGGVGLFSFTIGCLAGAVTLVEREGASTEIAEYNQSIHQLKQLQIIHCAVENLNPFPESPSSTMNQVALIDPPRAGLKPNVIESLSQMPLNKLAYLSCNPETQMRDLELFANAGWKCQSITPYDFFPRSYHIESLAILTP